jgi:hypothetical protein
VIVVTQSVADPEALSGQPGLLPSLTDNFSGIVAHRQTAHESRDWLAKLMGTRALWQSTNQTTGHGAQHSGRGSARRVREFRIGSDTFAELGRGEAIIYTTLGPDPRRATILPVELDSREPERIGAGVRHPCELRVHPEERLPAATDAAGEADTPMGPILTAHGSSSVTARAEHKRRDLTCRELRRCGARARLLPSDHEDDNGCRTGFTRSCRAVKRYAKNIARGRRGGTTRAADLLSSHHRRPLPVVAVPLRAVAVL